MERGISAPWRKSPSGITSSSRPPRAVQSRRASSSSLSDWLSHSARFRPRSQPSRMIAATSRPLPQPVPSPSIQPRRKRTGADRVSPSSVRVMSSRVLVTATLDSLPAGTDPVTRREMAVMGLARQYDAFELGVRQETVRHDAFRQHGAV